MIPIIGYKLSTSIIYNKLKVKCGVVDQKLNLVDIVWHIFNQIYTYLHKNIKMSAKYFHQTIIQAKDFHFYLSSIATFLQNNIICCAPYLNISNLYKVSCQDFDNFKYIQYTIAPQTFLIFHSVNNIILFNKTEEKFKRNDFFNFSFNYKRSYSFIPEQFNIDILVFMVYITVVVQNFCITFGIWIYEQRTKAIMFFASKIEELYHSLHSKYNILLNKLKCINQYCNLFILQNIRVLSINYLPFHNHLKPTGNTLHQTINVYHEEILSLNFQFYNPSNDIILDILHCRKPNKGISVTTTRVNGGRPLHTYKTSQNIYSEDWEACSCRTANRIQNDSLYFIIRMRKIAVLRRQSDAVRGSPLGDHNSMLPKTLTTIDTYMIYAKI
ncbi:hypothetical protein AGLY_004347 [Aphis glycines]|uniref:Uncharacterized protein n=1 Tax=Aphis glycines TaxID=307491 RepID=A0A6G0TXT8_APHGL|nr:hypothetical protein AGLY_004347 [Aphis glycines]